MSINSLRTVGLAAAVLLLASACASGDGNAGSGDGGKTVCYVTAASSHPYVTPFNDEATKVAEANDIDQIVLSQEFDAQKGADQLGTCIGRKPDAIMLWPLDPKAYLSGLARAKAADIPVILVNSPMDPAADEFIVSFTGPDTYDEGKMSAEAMNKALNGKGTVVIIAGQAGNGTTIERTKGFTEGLKELGSGIKVLDTVNADFDKQKALSVSRDLITRFGAKIQGVYAEDDTMASGFLEANKQAGGKLKPVVVGINGQQDAFEAIKAGDMYATILQSPAEDGKLAMETIVKILDGETVDERLPIPLTVVTKDNVGSVEPAF